jgi:hypothetical protein
LKVVPVTVVIVTLWIKMLMFFINNGILGVAGKIFEEKLFILTS